MMEDSSVLLRSLICLQELTVDVVPWEHCFVLSDSDFGLVGRI